MQHPVQVAARFRPLVDHELAADTDRDSNKTRWHQDEGRLLVHDGQRRFMFDHVFDPHHTNAEVSANVGARAVKRVIEGFNATIIAYGQAGSGKTHTMYGEEGVIEFCIGSLFQEIHSLQDQRKTHRFRLYLSFLEIYNEHIHDLMVKRNENETPETLRIKGDDPSTGTTIEGLTRIAVESPRAVFDLIAQAESQRHTRDTSTGAKSSRSHAIVQFYVEMQRDDVKDEDNHSFNNEQTEKTHECRISTLMLVDLAGSEKYTPSTSEALLEGGHMNRSLLALREVVTSLTACQIQEQFVPYRNSLLTRLLRQSLSGNSITLIICTASTAAENDNETEMTLVFGSLCRRVMTVPKQALFQRSKDLRTTRTKSERTKQQLVSRNPSKTCESPRKHKPSFASLDEEEKEKEMLPDSVFHTLTAKATENVALGDSTRDLLAQYSIRTQQWWQDGKVNQTIESTIDVNSNKCEPSFQDGILSESFEEDRSPLSIQRLPSKAEEILGSNNLYLTRYESDDSSSNSDVENESSLEDKSSASYEPNHSSSSSSVNSSTPGYSDMFENKTWTANSSELQNEFVSNSDSDLDSLNEECVKEFMKYEELNDLENNEADEEEDLPTFPITTLKSGQRPFDNHLEDIKTWEKEMRQWYLDSVEYNDETQERAQLVEAAAEQVDRERRERAMSLARREAVFVADMRRRRSEIDGSRMQIERAEQDLSVRRENLLLRENTVRAFEHSLQRWQARLETEEESVQDLRQQVARLERERNEALDRLAKMNKLIIGPGKEQSQTHDNSQARPVPNENTLSEKQAESTSELNKVNNAISAGNSASTLVEVYTLGVTSCAGLHYQNLEDEEDEEDEEQTYRASDEDASIQRQIPDLSIREDADLQHTAIDDCHDDDVSDYSSLNSSIEQDEYSASVLQLEKSGGNGKQESRTPHPAVEFGHDVQDILFGLAEMSSMSSTMALDKRLADQTVLRLAQVLSKILLITVPIVAQDVKQTKPPAPIKDLPFKRRLLQRHLNEARQVLVGFVHKQQKLKQLHSQQLEEQQQQQQQQ